MSVKIKKNIITMTRGDTLRTTLSITDSDGNEYIPVEGDKIRFALKRNYSDEDVLILKEISIDKMELYLAPEDTKQLSYKVPYVFDVEITMVDGTVDTFIKGTLTVTEEVL